MKLPNGWKIVKGPNWQWYAATVFFLWVSISERTVWWIAGWLLFNIAMIPICIWLHNWNKKRNERMLRDFPLDPYIQRKYGGR